MNRPRNRFLRTLIVIFLVVVLTLSIFFGVVLWAYYYADYKSRDFGVDATISFAEENKGLLTSKIIERDSIHDVYITDRNGEPTVGEDATFVRYSVVILGQDIASFVRIYDAEGALIFGIDDGI